ncbi:MAG: lysylphosphatidylglycerol synthase transmembrane domain-containing protein [bacterium]|nr:lysylphosphatidylglycerol synthase transmembrane domain-containing protein [bacterium]
MNWKKVKTAATFLIALYILFVIYSKIDLRAFWNLFRDIDYFWFAAGMFIFIVSALISSFRYVVILSGRAKIPLLSSLKLYLAGNSLNMALPSKIGDLSKAVFLKKEGILGYAEGFSSVIVEKIFDVSALSSVMVAGLVFLPLNTFFTRDIKKVFLAAGMFFLSLPLAVYILGAFKVNVLNKTLSKADEYFARFHDFLMALKKSPGKLVLIALLSFFLWFSHVFQVFCFLKSFDNSASAAISFALIPIAIFIGLIPIAFAGIGTRDKALIVLFGWYGYPDYLMAAVGIMCTVRYVIPALFGLPFMIKYMAKDKKTVR